MLENSAPPSFMPVLSLDLRAYPGADAATIRRLAIEDFTAALDRELRKLAPAAPRPVPCGEPVAGSPRAPCPP